MGGIDPNYAAGLETVKRFRSIVLLSWSVFRRNSDER
jgi:hypothetical protein